MRETLGQESPQPAAEGNRRLERRGFLMRAGIVPGLAAGLALTGCAAMQPPRVGPGRPVLIRGGTVLSMDPAVGDFDQGDVLIDGDRIAAVGPSLAATGAETVEASGMIVMPGFIDSHRHLWQGQLRNLLPDGTLAEYLKSVNTTARNLYRPEDVYLGNLLGAWGAINAGITTLLDWSHVSSTPEHTEAAIRGLRDTGIRAVYAFGGGAPGPAMRHPDDLRRLRATHFNSDDQRLTLALATGLNPAHWRLARDVGAPITVHANGRGQLLPLAEQKALGPDLTYIHCCLLTDAEWQRVADSGGTVSMSAPVEMGMGHGVPPVQQVLDRRIPASLSNDVETSTCSDFFTQMRTVFMLQRMQAFSRQRAGERDAPAPMTVRQVLQIATIGGARVTRLERRAGSLTPGKALQDVKLSLLRAGGIKLPLWTRAVC
jgi:cytosine/adenosine deaminase-related metal-dependent hydrolase